MINKISSINYINTKKRVNSNQNIDKVTFEKRKVVVKKVKKSLFDFLNRKGLKIKTPRLFIKHSLPKPPAF